MKRKNTSGSFGGTLFHIIFFAIMLSLAAALALAIARGAADFSALSLGQWLVALPSWVCIVCYSVSLWLRWKEIRVRDRALGVTPEERKSRRRRFLAGLAVFGLIAAVPLTGIIHFQVDSLENWFLTFVFYLVGVLVVVMLPCYLICGLGKALGEKELEREELDEAKKY